MRRASLETIAKKMKGLDLCMMITQDGRHGLHARPMSNNGRVDYDGDSWFFTFDESPKVRQIEASAGVTLTFQRDGGLFIECYGHASIVKQRSILEQKWVDGLERWFPEGLDTPGICLIKVAATRVQFWDGEDEGEYRS